LLSSSASNLIASSADTWAEFRSDVKTKMEKEVKTKFASYSIFIEPHGSDSYGVAIASGVSAGAKQPLTILGIYDKKSQKLEIVEIEGMKDLVVLGQGGAQSARQATPAPAATAAPPPATAADSFKMPLPPRTTLQRGKRYVSSDGKHYLIFQDDNNLVIYRVADNAFVWGLNEQPKVDYKKANAARVTDQRRFTVLDSANREIWGFDMNGPSGAMGTHLDITSDGHLTARDP